MAAMSVSPAELVARMEGVRHWPLRVLAVDSPTPRTRRVRLGGTEGAGGLADLSPLPGQDLMFWVPRADGSRVYRRYTIRRLDPVSGHLDVVVALHEGGGPGMTWAASLVPGDPVDAVGPRGKITIVPAPFHLFVGDDAYVPTAFAMIEALPQGVRALALLEVVDAAEERRVPLPSGAEVRWRHRGGAVAGEPGRLLDALAAIRPEPGWHAYVGAELGVAASVVEALRALGLDQAGISSKAYWRHGRPNAERGEPPKDDGPAG